MYYVYKYKRFAIEIEMVYKIGRVRTLFTAGNHVTASVSIYTKM